MPDDLKATVQSEITDYGARLAQAQNDMNTAQNALNEASRRVLAYGGALEACQKLLATLEKNDAIDDPRD